MFHAFLSAQSKTHSILGQKEVKGPIGEEGSVESNQFKRYFVKNPKCFFVKTQSRRIKT